jgi:hypothetical protein
MVRGRVGNALQQKRKTNSARNMKTTTTSSNGGRKTFLVEVLFWTNNIAEKEGEVIPRHTWDCGVVKIPVEKNPRHGLKNVGNPIPFHGLNDIERAVRKCLRNHEIVQHIG